MDFVTALIYGLAAEQVISRFVAAHLVLAVWAVFAVVLGGLVAELAAQARMDCPRLWAVMVALAPPAILPFFLLQRREALGRRGFDHRARYHRCQGYRAALAALIIWGIVELAFFLFVLPGFGPAIAPPLQPAILRILSGRAGQSGFPIALFL